MSYKVSQYELNRAYKQLEPMRSRKLSDSLPADVVDQVECLKDNIDSGFHVEKVEWLLTGSYGVEYMELLINHYQQSPRKKQAIKTIVIEAFIITALIDHDALNTYKIKQIVKESGRMDEINEHLIEYMTTGYGAEHWGLID